MGGGSYYRDVDTTSRVRSEDFNLKGHLNENTGRREVHPDLDPKGTIRECRDSIEHPLVMPIKIDFDVTRSRGKDTETMFEKLPMLIGQLIMRDYLKGFHPEISFSAIGDATAGDFAPCQVGQFESDERLDKTLLNIWREEGGGGTGQESYELMAYFNAFKTQLDILKHGKKGYNLILGDEAPYEKIVKDQIKRFIGDNVPADIPTEEEFKRVQESYHTFFFYFKKNWQKRKEDIDSEIKARVREAGGMVEGVDIRVSLLWRNRNDLDLHIVDPCGHHIYYGSYCKGNGRPPAPCGGFLDIDMNVHGEKMKPVENTRWEKGKAPEGPYEVFVQNYACHGHAAATEFEVEIEVNGKVMHFEGVTPKGRTGSASDTIVYEFDYYPSREQTLQTDVYANYNDEHILNQWKKYLPEDHVLVLDDPRGVVDLMMGVIAITEDNGVDLDKYIADMVDREQTETRCTQIRNSLTQYVNMLTMSKVEVNKLNLLNRKISRKKKTKRL